MLTWNHDDAAPRSAERRTPRGLRIAAGFRPLLQPLPRPAPGAGAPPPRAAGRRAQRVPVRGLRVLGRLPQGHGGPAPPRAVKASPLILLASLLAAGVSVSGAVFADANGNGRRDAGEAGLAGVVVTDGTTVVATDAAGEYALADVTAAQVFVVTPGDRRAVGSWYRAAAPRVDFPLAAAPLPARWRFAHLSDVHVDALDGLPLPRGPPGRRPRAAASTWRSSAATSSSTPCAPTAPPPAPAMPPTTRWPRGLARARSARHRQPRRLRHRPALEPRRGRAGLRQGALRGEGGTALLRVPPRPGPLPRAGHDRRGRHALLRGLDEAQLEWIRRELRYVPAGTTVVTVGHIPLRSGALALTYAAEGLARSLLSVGGRTSYPHVVRNAEALAEILRPYRWTLALQGHTHVAERLPAEAGARTRYHTAPAVTGLVGPSPPPASSSTESRGARWTTASWWSSTPFRARANSSSARSRTTSSRAAPRRG